MGFFDLPPRTMTIIAVILGYLMIDDLTPAEQNSLGNFLILIGQVLETNSAQAQVIANREASKRMDDFESRIKRLEEN